MPLRWLLCPVVNVPQFNEESGTTSFYRGPKICLYAEPGRSRPYRHINVIDAPNWCVSLVRAVDFTPLNGDSEITDLFETDYERGADILTMTPRQLGWNALQLTRLTTILTSKGVVVTGLTSDVTLGAMLDRLCAAITPAARPQRERI